MANLLDMYRIVVAGHAWAACYDRRTMGVTHVAGKVYRAGRRRRPIVIRFLVDTGAVYTVLPENVWRALGLKGERVVEFTLADGTAIRRQVSECRVQVEDRGATSPVVLGGPADAPLLGAVTLETLGLMVNPLTRELLPMRLILASAIPHDLPLVLQPS
jgi:aspartyl protease family protein